METTNKYIKEIAAKLHSGNDNIILAVISELRQTGSAEILPYVFELVSASKSSEVRDSAIQFLSNIKDKTAVPFIVKELVARKYGENYSRLVATCWQSRLNYSEYMDTFVLIFVKENYQTALEAFTVIEESLVSASQDKRTACYNLLLSKKKSIAEDKIPLYRELIKIVGSYE
ncbi:MAG: HEAT repeat domain-containing protein [Bacteroidales bacterium]|nr:HEAT repeat domain-containing protein [Bacteroidales bacterium]